MKSYLEPTNLFLSFDRRFMESKWHFGGTFRPDIDTMLLCRPIGHMGHFDVWREFRRACVLPGQTVGPVRLIVAGLHNPPPPPSAGSTGWEGGQ